MGKISKIMYKAINCLSGYLNKFMNNKNTRDNILTSIVVFFINFIDNELFLMETQLLIFLNKRGIV